MPKFSMRCQLVPKLNNMPFFFHELDVFQSVICSEPGWNPSVNQDDILEIKKVPMTSNKDIGVSSTFIIILKRIAE